MSDTIVAARVSRYFVITQIYDNTIAEDEDLQILKAIGQMCYISQRKNPRYAGIFIANIQPQAKTPSKFSTKSRAKPTRYIRPTIASKFIIGESLCFLSCLTSQ